MYVYVYSVPWGKFQYYGQWLSSISIVATADQLVPYVYPLWHSVSSPLGGVCMGERIISYFREQILQILNMLYYSKYHSNKTSKTNDEWSYVAQGENPYIAKTANTKVGHKYTCYKMVFTLLSTLTQAIFLSYVYCI